MPVAFTANAIGSGPLLPFGESISAILVPSGAKTRTTISMPPARLTTSSTADSIDDVGDQVEEGRRQYDDVRNAAGEVVRDDD